MSKLYTNNYSYINLYRKKSSESEVVTQMIYGDAFSAIKKSNKWWKIKIKEDGYIGFVKNQILENPQAILRLDQKLHLAKKNRDLLNFKIIGSKSKI